ncbi:type 2 isopentenyl-diphosphate Delta-isomerase [Brevibacillus centrosporus]|uniref:type 2 isopentenyl-diphosphate Delta-isomerase n=1 Tax=Brevibacillus centrosporus TaxID=54910 RepID=UPI002E1DF156|nr:type 2 isopentenyl-diphosphate Delta-isomerase [Brevibacillus centrosporus]MED1950847.1 type 2 isopentenyl-diphosphate Delta-isomerase [Brevibacillus centrosporus]
MDRATRKVEHVQHALSTNEFGANAFDDVSFLPNSLPNSSYETTSLDCKVGPYRLRSPIMINAMTGGAATTTDINRKLAVLARERGLAMAVGSQMAAIRDPQVKDSYEVVRKEHPKGILFANVGAEATVEEALAAVEMIEADGLQIHLNVMQELLMPEGDRDFRGYLQRIHEIKERAAVPVMVKEVGFGMARKTIRELAQAGITVIDVGGRGGTNFAKVENMRRPEPLTMFDEWGLTTVDSLLEAACESGRGVHFVATGGIRNGLDAAKAIALGASAVGMAGAVLKQVQTRDVEGGLAALDEWHQQVRIAMTALGAHRLEQLREQPVMITGKTAEKARLRGIALEEWAQKM